MIIKVPISFGELVDKITILRIKQNKIDDKEKRKFIEDELQVLVRYFSSYSSVDIVREFTELETVNKKLWDIEDKLRVKESKKEFDKEFIELARSVYFTNDKRAEIKKKINELTGSDIMEVKSYVEYSE
jgi:hypothetical protein|tara:strand:- start:10 stop:396 length:387 start_codon:yes stop_codon:yes gene_type:complete